MIDTKQYVAAAAELEEEAQRHLATAEKCRVAAAALRELAGEIPERRVTPRARRPAGRAESASRPAAKAITREKERKLRKILCACGCGETFEWEVKTGRAPQYIPEHKPKRNGKPDEPKPSPATAAVDGRASQLLKEVTAPPRGDGPAPRWNCPKHGSTCRTPNLCKSTYTRTS